jgi:DNA/RNA-binding domain of Phe-tRNA-synthetase-like protein
VNKQFRWGEAIRTLPWNAALGVVTITDVDCISLERGLSQLPHSPSKSGITGNVERLSRRIQAFESFFAESGYHCPLEAQCELVWAKGLPLGNPIVRALLLAETSAGLLMGAQSLSALDGELIYDLASEGQTFEGMRGQVQCRHNEVVLRDATGIIASMFQGPDRRTKLRKETKDLIFFVFSAPRISVDEVQEGISVIRAIFTGACSAICAHVHEFRG